MKSIPTIHFKYALTLLQFCDISSVNVTFSANDLVIAMHQSLIELLFLSFEGDCGLSMEPLLGSVLHSRSDCNCNLRLSHLNWSAFSASAHWPASPDPGRGRPPNTSRISPVET